MRPARVQLLVTCLVDRFFPGTGESVVRVLERAGVAVTVPAGQTCCGQPAFNAGYDDEARALARHTIDVLSASDDPVVVPSGSCGDMVIHQYVALLGDDPEYGPKARALAARTYELTIFLTRVLGVTDVGAQATGTLSYHACCHGLRGLGVDSEPKALLAGVARRRHVSAARSRGLLRVRRPVRGQDVRHLGRDAGPQARRDRGVRRRHDRRHRRQLRHAHERRPAPARQQGPGRAHRRRARRRAANGRRLVNPVDVPFYRRVEDALGKTRMRQAVRHTSGRAMESRRAAIAELDSSDAVRDQARAIRARTLAALDQHLDTFATNVEKNGGTVFFAETGDDAVDYVRRLARDRGVKVAVKSKSMVSEEIELNPVLEGNGIEVVETDLGEYIVQLDNDKPSHIVAPILHKTKEDCARVFKEKLGATDEEVAGVPQMTQLARRVLRQAFLRGRHGHQRRQLRRRRDRQRLHLHQRGQRPAVDDAAAHPRRDHGHGAAGADRRRPRRDAGGARAQRHRPAADGLLEHPQRTAAAGRGGRARGVPRRHRRQRPQRGARRASWPRSSTASAAAPASTPAPSTSRSAATPTAASTPGRSARCSRRPSAGIHAFHDLPHASTLCGACKEVCPVRIDIPRMLLRLRAKGVEAGESPQWVSLGIKVLGWIGTRPRLFGLAGRVAARVAGADGQRRLDPRAAAAPGRMDRVPRLPRPGQGVVPGALGASEHGGAS